MLKPLFSSILFILLLLLSGCDCGCSTDLKLPQYQTVYSSQKPTSTTVTSTQTVPADGCVSSDGTILQVCNGQNTGNLISSNVFVTPNGYTSQGNWVQVPDIAVTSQTLNLNLNIYGSVAYCSTGYDNKNIAPPFNVSPGMSPSASFSDGSNLIVEPGQFVMIQGINAPGLTIYVGGQEVITLDNSDPRHSANIFSGFTNNQLNGYTDGHGVFRQGMLDSFNLEYHLMTDDLPPANIITSNSGRGLYAFMVPMNMAGALGFSMAGPAQYVQYPLTIYTTPPACVVDSSQSSITSCMVNPATSAAQKICPTECFNDPTVPSQQTCPNSTLGPLPSPPACYVDLNANPSLLSCASKNFQSINQPGKRGALQLYISNINPNITNGVYQNMSALFADNIQFRTYYQQLQQYIAQNAGITINNNAQVLSDIVISPPITPIVITSNSYSTSPTDLGNIWLLVRDDYYNDNVGAYQVTATVTNSLNAQKMNFLQELITPITDITSKSSVAIYNSFYQDSNFASIIRAMLLLYLILLGFQYALGLNRIHANDLLVRVIKIVIVAELLDPNSWAFFTQYLFQLFTSGSTYLISAVSGDNTQHNVNLFAFVDDVFNIFFQKATWVRIAALMLDLIGFLLAAILIYVMIMYLFIIARVLLTYLLCIVSISILLSIAPIFIMMILFDRTKKYFDGWIKYLADFALQSVILFAIFAFVNAVFVNLWLSTMSFDVCYGGVFPFYLNLSFLADLTSQSKWSHYLLGCFDWYLPVGVTIIELIAEVLALYVLINAIRGLINHSADISSHITGAFTSGINTMASNIEQTGKDVVTDSGKLFKNISLGDSGKDDHKESSTKGQGAKLRGSMDARKTTAPRPSPRGK